jgi:hypothetical protein
MLFNIAPNTPRFQVFTALNQELLTFVENAQATGDFRRTLFSVGNVGQACWNNSKANNAGAINDLTYEKFEKFFIEIQNLSDVRRNALYECLRDNQDLSIFFNNPQPNLLSNFPAQLRKKFQTLATHLYTSTKDLELIVRHCSGIDIKAHFSSYRRKNGNVCKACGMHLLSPYRHNTSDEDQWRADYDHQLCKSKYPLYAVHPDNLIPLCDVCNQDAKKSKNLFLDDDENSRLSFYPYEDSCKDYVGVVIDNLRDPEINVDIEWLSNNEEIINKLDTWNDVYEIKDLALGRYFDLVTRLIDAINPINFEHLKNQITDKAREPTLGTYKREPWTFWELIFFSKLSLLDDDELEAIWCKVEFTLNQGEEGALEIEQGA